MSPAACDDVRLREGRGARSEMPIRTLSDLVTTANMAAFSVAFATKARWHAEMPMRTDISELCPWPTFDALIATGAIPADKFAVLLNAKSMLKSFYVDERGQLRPDAIQAFAAQGATLTVNNIDRFVPAIGELATAIERELCCKTGVNAYISFGTKSAFLAHSDDHDVLIVQLQGVKHWRTYGVPEPFPTRSVHMGSPPPCEWEGRMTPGDLLYLPRGEVHAAVPEEQPSMHLTIGIAEQTGVDFIAWLATKAKEVVALRRDLGATLPREARVARDRELIQSILDLLETATVGEFEALQATQRSLRPLASFGIAGRLTPTSRLVSALRREVDLMVEREGAAQLVIGEQRFRLSLNGRLALANINHLGTVSFGALTEELAGKMSVNDLAKAIQELAEKSLVAIAED